ncbi:MAG: FAD-dependent oxidoreductase, partial [Selenomonadales bacterium]|nr:FAD-dependent oxidoreductase [Selenomonadales bacterium]
KQAGCHVNQTIFQLPSKMGKGVLVSPTVHGNLLVGPTAADIENKEGTDTTQKYLDSLGPMAALSVKNVPLRQVITSFAGLRAHEVDGDFVLGEAEDAPGFFNAAGVESPGLSSAPAIGEYLADMVAEKLALAGSEPMPHDKTYAKCFAPLPIASSSAMRSTSFARTKSAHRSGDKSIMLWRNCLPVPPLSYA